MVLDLLWSPDEVAREIAWQHVSVEPAVFREAALVDLGGPLDVRRKAYRRLQELALSGDCEVVLRAVREEEHGTSAAYRLLND